ncbi:MAG: hypothetical protein LW832_03545 [Parachlamydia sp.]|jgi:hypothetical protein|nr:hypothetical protein [Parachlamydia sp.]
MSSYRVDNWSEYNRSLINRGSLTLWISDDAVNKLLEKKVIGKNGRPVIDSNCFASIKMAGQRQLERVPKP